jgi:hypothetical protein
MGDSRGRWDGDTLVSDVIHFNDQTWFDRAGNFHSDALHLVERFSLTGPRPRSVSSAHAWNASVSAGQPATGVGLTSGGWAATGMDASNQAVAASASVPRSEYFLIARSST